MLPVGSPPQAEYPAKPDTFLFITASFSWMNNKQLPKNMKFLWTDCKKPGL